MPAVVLKEYNTLNNTLKVSRTSDIVFVKLSMINWKSPDEIYSNKAGNILEHKNVNEKN